MTGYKTTVGGADTVFPFSKTFLSINEFKSSMQPTKYNIGFRPKLVLCGANADAAFAWYNADTNKCYYNANTARPYDLGTFSYGNIYKFNSIDDTGFTFQVGASNYDNMNLIIIAFG